MGNAPASKSAAVRTRLNHPVIDSDGHTTEDIRDLFVPNFYFGCEADDPMNAWAFNARVNPCGARLKAIFSSDIGHWDVPDMTEVVEEAHELVERGIMTEEDFRDFVFTNPVTLWTDMNPEFFKGMRVESAVASKLRTGQNQSQTSRG